MKSFAFFGAGTIVLAGAIASIPSCYGPPSKTCFADRVNALEIEDGAHVDRRCTTCLQSKAAPNACCDAVGACSEDPEGQCVESFQRTHLCVVDGGASEESRCKENLTGTRSRELYECMRRNCGEECGVPSCDLDPSVPLFADSACDGCITGSCCKKLNACYESRRCKLAVECVIEQCPRTLGPLMTALGELSPSEFEEAVLAIRNGEPLEQGRCMHRCLNDFAPYGDAGTGDDLHIRTLALDVFACGAQTRCGPKCERADGGAHHGEAWPEDTPISSERAP